MKLKENKLAFLLDTSLSLYLNSIELRTDHKLILKNRKEAQ